MCSYVRAGFIVTNARVWLRTEPGSRQGLRPERIPFSVWWRRSGAGATSAVPVAPEGLYVSQVGGHLLSLSIFRLAVSSFLMLRSV